MERSSWGRHEYPSVWRCNRKGFDTFFLWTPGSDYFLIHSKKFLQEGFCFAISTPPSSSKIFPIAPLEEKGFLLFPSFPLNPLPCREEDLVSLDFLHSSYESGQGLIRDSLDFNFFSPKLRLFHLRSHIRKSRWSDKTLGKISRDGDKRKEDGYDK